MYLFEPLDRIIRQYLPADKIELVKRAFVVARDAHEGQTRSSGEPYITHPVAVAGIIAEMKLDHEAVMAALLHDVIEDTPYTEEQLAAEFGKNVAEIVQGVSIPHSPRSTSGELPQDDFGDDQRYSRGINQTCRPHAQYAYAGFTPP